MAHTDQTNLKKTIEELLATTVVGSRALSGGCLGKLEKITLKDGRVIVAKVGDGLECEGWMLQYLLENSVFPVPTVIYVDPQLLLMTYIEATTDPLSSNLQVDLAHHVAALHTITAPRFGLERDTVIGPLCQLNSYTQSWLDFFRDRRLLFMANEAWAAGTLPDDTFQRLQLLCDKLEHLIPDTTTPRLVHGDLWGGNILSNKGSIVGFIDPAIYYADPEIELAFMTLFHTVDQTFFDAYREHRDIDPEFFSERRELYLLYPLLVHVRLFGSSYLGQLDQILRHYLR